MSSSRTDELMEDLNIRHLSIRELKQGMRLFKNYIQMWFMENKMVISKDNVVAYHLNGILTNDVDINIFWHYIYNDKVFDNNQFYFKKEDGSVAKCGKSTFYKKYRKILEDVYMTSSNKYEIVYKGVNNDCKKEK